MESYTVYCLRLFFCDTPSFEFVSFSPWLSVSQGEQNNILLPGFITFCWASWNISSQFIRSLKPISLNHNSFQRFSSTSHNACHWAEINEIVLIYILPLLVHSYYRNTLWFFLSTKSGVSKRKMKLFVNYYFY